MENSKAFDPRDHSWYGLLSHDVNRFLREFTSYRHNPWTEEMVEFKGEWEKKYGAFAPDLPVDDWLDTIKKVNMTLCRLGRKRFTPFIPELGLY